MNKIEVSKISLTKAEGHCCGERTVTVAGYKDANSQLLRWSSYAPKDGGYDKCDFTIFFEDGSEYNGRFDLKYSGNDWLEDHVRDFSLWHGGVKENPWCGEARYREMMKNLGEDIISYYKNIVDKYQLSQCLQ